MFFHGIGTGKTLTALWTISQIWHPEKTLVVCPRSAFRAWKRDIENHIGWPYRILEGSAEERRKMLSDNADIFIVNYEGLKSIYAGLKRHVLKDQIPTRQEAEELKKTIGGMVLRDTEHTDCYMLAKSSGWTVNHKEFIDEFDCVVFDEVHKCKDSDSLQSEICHNLSWRAKYVIGMTGTPIAHNLLDLWPVVRVVDLGNALGQSFYKFKNRYFYKVGFGEWIPYGNTEERILKQLLPFTTSFAREDCIDLPPATYQDRVAYPTQEQEKILWEIITGLKVELSSGTLNTDNVLVRAQKAKQVAGGFVYVGEGSDRKTHKFAHNEKLDLLNDIVEEHSGKIIIFHEYPPEGEIIEAWAKTKGLTFASLRGSTVDKTEQERKFIEDDSDLLIANSTVAGTSLDFTVSAIEVFYSHSGSIITRDQCEGRIRRSGQYVAQLFLNLLLAGSPDEVLVERAVSRRELSERLLTYIRSYGT
jgi:SNF2 family DNA or RNA helicase